MDPNEALKQLRAAVADLEDQCCAECGEMAGRDIAEKFADLDAWMTSGGFMPTDWNALRGR